jgi:hypothetical protein
MPETLDLVWHEFILHTKEYAEFCKCLPNGEFVHHNPQTVLDFININKSDSDTLSDSDTSTESDAPTYENQTKIQALIAWLPLYVDNFGPFTLDTAQYYYAVQLLMQQFNYSLEQINTLASAHQ